MPSSSASTMVRQQPGYACEECRRRKARCDRVRPQCGFCVETGTACVIIEKRPQRGPKRGQLSAMRSRIATLERQLCDRQGLVAPYQDSNAGPIVDTSAPVPASAPVTTEQHAPVADMELEHGGSDSAGSSKSMSFAGSATSEAPSLMSTTSSSASLCAPTPILPSQDTTGLTLWTELNWQDLEHSSSVAMMQPCSVSPANMMMDIPQLHLDLVGAHIGGHGAYAPASSLESDSFEVVISDLIQADLDQLYFERVHPVVPMIHQRRYFLWADDETLSPERAGLRSAMRTMAAAMSAQFRSLSDTLYQETLRLLEVRGHAPAPTLSDSMEMPIERIQAWLLLAHYEILRVNQHQAMITAGRAFRLVQMARLYELDREEASDDFNHKDSFADGHCNSPKPDPQFAALEEKRRTFWLAYSLDRFLCSRNDWPLTLQEEMIRTRLPAPETNFQQSKRICVGYLADIMRAMAQPPSTSPPLLSPFAEIAVMATLHGMCISHRRTLRASAAMTDFGAGESQPDNEFWVYHEWLTSVVEKRAQVLSQHHDTTAEVSSVFSSSPGGESDPMVLFTRMLAYGSLVHLNATVQAIRSPWQTAEHQRMTAAAGWRADGAAVEMVRLAKSVKQLSCFKVHPFLSDPLECAAEFLLARRQAQAIDGIFAFDADVTGIGGGQGSRANGDDGGVEHLLRVLSYLGDTNNLARDLLFKLSISHNIGVKAFGQEVNFSTNTCREGIFQQAGRSLSAGWKRLASF
ncbi:hypothetical protein QBC42DRAFT_219505 [Cladorrhinum samala]|uniref:Zn(2)-C6 fungal-type domain-containing protein n=1 Tax=Cladorrhinum samala TaxID=585594 RepID=A0AAV9HZE7_9PEZI|nr:hypothetical protein QBC42DRAFT_219505 [Cladorrhinum samala]